MSYERKEAVIKAVDVNLSYDRPILRDINLEIKNIVRPGVQQGQISSLVGRSGIGKSQLFKILSGLKKPTSGQVLIGDPLVPVKPGDVGIVSQRYVLFRSRTVMSNLMLAIAQSDSNLSKAEAKERIMAYAAEFDLLKHVDRWPDELSGGQRQRVSILQQLMTGNKTILMDEPFSGLDVIVLQKVLNLIVKVSLIDEHNTIIIVSHDIENSLAISDSAYVLANEQSKDENGIPMVDGNGQPAMIPGATIVEQIDLAEQGLAFQPNIIQLPRFREVLEHVKQKL
jgi:ABC-type nitrate/sulfonate/bicarbonate transport system ATPase subunit